jgi:integrase
LLLLGFAGAFRRSELVSLDVADLEFTRAGLIVTLTSSACSLGRLSDKAVALVVKRSAKAVGLDQARYAGHSLRAGLATSAAAAGASERVIMSQTGLRSADMVRRYIRDGSLFASNPAAMLGL